MSPTHVFVDDVEQTIHGDEVMDNLQDIRDQITALPPVDDNGPATVTVLGAGVDGDAATLLVDAAKGVLWPLRYRSSSPSAFKWEALDPTPLFSAVNPAGGETCPAVFAAQDLATVGPQLTVPLDGDYEMWLGAYTDIAALLELVILKNGAGFLTPVLGTAPLDMHFQLPNLAAGDVIKMQYANADGAPHQIFDRWLAIRPRRVSE